MSSQSLPEHPRLLFNRQGIDALKMRIERCGWAQKRWRVLLQSGEGWLKETVTLPPRGGNWYHYYACPEHGAALRTGEQIGEWQWEHICPVDNKRFRSDPNRPDQDYDGCVIMTVHGQMANRVRDLGILYQVTGDARYARKAAEIALQYAQHYTSYPLHTIRGEARIGGGKVGPQTLDEAVWLIPMAQGVDLIWQTLSPSDHDLLAQNLFLPAAREVILPHQLGVHNIQCWKNSAVGLVGLLLEEEELIQQAIHHPERGYWTQVRKGVTADGMWWEGAWGYHFYTLSALWHLTEAARHCGIDLYGEELKRMYDAPFRFATPGLLLPAFNDSTEVNLRAQAPAYELAYARYKNPLYVQLLATSNRENDYALWFGVESLPKPGAIRWRSANYPTSGYAILAKGRGDSATWLCLKYGPHGGGHGHPDKLHLEIHAGGAPVAADPGMARYGVPIHANWYRTTLAHNTLVVDESDQQPTEGKCLQFGSANGVDFVVASAGAIYPDVRFVRAVALLSEAVIVVLDSVRCEGTRLLDVAFHLQGSWEHLPGGTNWQPPAKRGYSYLSEPTIRPVEGATTLSIRRSGGNTLTATLASDAPFELITALGVGKHSQDRVPMLLLRRKGNTLRAVWALSLKGKHTQAQVFPPPSGGDGAFAVQVTLPDGRKRLLALNPQGTPISLQTPDGSKWRVESYFGML
ncbi:MAG: heparinase II/III domain-containing protein [Armatimonadota bacterium]